MFITALRTVWVDRALRSLLGASMTWFVFREGG